MSSNLLLFDPTRCFESLVSANGEDHDPRELLDGGPGLSLLFLVAVSALVLIIHYFRGECGFHHLVESNRFLFNNPMVIRHILVLEFEVNVDELLRAMPAPPTVKALLLIVSDA